MKVLPTIWCCMIHYTLKCGASIEAVATLYGCTAQQVGDANVQHVKMFPGDVPVKSVRSLAIREHHLMFPDVGCTTVARIFGTSESSVLACWNRYEIRELRKTLFGKTVKETVTPVRIASYGFTGESCQQCQSMKMVRTGTCSTCQDCGFSPSCG